MRTVIQRVSQASVQTHEGYFAQIGKGLLILVGIEEEDNDEDICWLTSKIAQLRIFNDNEGVMNLSVSDISGEILVISQFTLHASTKKGNRPSYIKAAKPDKAIPLYNKFIQKIREEAQLRVMTGQFGAYMDIHLINDGPVTIIIDTKRKE